MKIKTPEDIIEIKKQAYLFEQELRALLHKHSVTLYAEDEYGNELNVSAYKKGYFDIEIKNTPPFIYKGD